MKIFRFDPEVGKSSEHYKSSGFIISRIAHLSNEAFVNCAYLSGNGLIGYHQATSPQLFLVVQGKGWVRGESPNRTPIQAGQAAYWEEGEWHESGTEVGMTAIIIESPNLHPEKLMPMIHHE